MILLEASINDFASALLPFYFGSDDEKNTIMFGVTCRFKRL